MNYALIACLNILNLETLRCLARWVVGRRMRFGLANSAGLMVPALGEYHTAQETRLAAYLSRQAGPS